MTLILTPFEDMTLKEKIFERDRLKKFIEDHAGFEETEAFVDEIKSHTLRLCAAIIREEAKINNVST